MPDLEIRITWEKYDFESVWWI